MYKTSRFENKTKRCKSSNKASKADSDRGSKTYIHTEATVFLLLNVPLVRVHYKLMLVTDDRAVRLNDRGKCVMHRSFDRFRGKYTANPIPRILYAAEDMAFILTDVFLTFPIPVLSQTCSNFAAPLKGDFVVVRRETEAAVTGSGERALSTISLVSCLKAE